MSKCPRFEVGVVYRKGARHCLAVSMTKLITFKEGRLHEVRPQAKYEVVRGISVDALCQTWEISLEDLDRETAKYLSPSCEGIKPRPRGSRRRKSADEFAWRNLRLTRLQAG